MKRVGKHTVQFDGRQPVITGHAGVAGKKEGEGPLKEDFDAVFEDTTMGTDSWEQAESALLGDAIRRALEKANKAPDEIQYAFAGDLLDQCTGSAFAFKDLDMPFVGTYGACSTMALTLALSSLFVAGGAADTCLAATSSHFCSSERQFRFPLEYGGQRPPTAQWTVTGAGAAVLENQGNGVRVEAVHLGRIKDLGITDANNMGAAMAPAAKQTIADFLRETESKPSDFDLILTGDLGFVGTKLLHELLKKEENMDITAQHNDCGLLIYHLKEQDVNSGGSGCGCSGSVLCGHILKEMERGKLHRIMFVATGALMSPTSAKQGQSIPGIAHGLILTTEGH